MPRIPRGQVSGFAYHVINRGNGGATVFHKEGDYRIFLDLLVAAKTKHPVMLLGFCLMPNHFHLVVQPKTPEALSAFMQWSLTAHVRRYHKHYRSHGHVWQGRFKSFPIQEDEHLLTVLRYVLCNPVRAHLAEKPDQWPWSSFQQGHLIDPLPILLPPDWNHLLETPLSLQELSRIRTSVNRQAPFGSPDWQTMIAKLLGLISSLTPRGRPRKTQTIPEK
jgi:putative transposase